MVSRDNILPFCFGYVYILCIHFIFLADQQLRVIKTRHNVRFILGSKSRNERNLNENRVEKMCHEEWIMNHGQVVPCLTLKLTETYYHLNGSILIPWDLGVCLTSCRHNLPETRLHYIYSPTLISLILFQIALWISRKKDM